MSFVVVYDACVLFPAPLRDLLVRLAMTGVFQAKWSERILDECFRNILERRRDLRMDQLSRTRELMNRAIRDVVVSGHELLEVSLQGFPDEDDRHVVAAAIHAGAQVIVTFNLKDFPSASLDPFNIEAQHPDEFVLNVIDLDAPAVEGVIRKQASDLKNPPRTVADLLETFREQGLVQSVAKLKELMDT